MRIMHCMSPLVGKSNNEVFDRVLVASILDKMGRDDRSTTKSLATLTFEQLDAQLNPAETRVIKQLLSLKPRALGFLGPFVSNEGPPPSLVPLEGQSFIRDDHKVVIVNQYLPRYVWDAFQKMQKAIKEDLGSTLMVGSGYRSPANQAITFLTYLEMNDFDIKYVANGVALPGYSQHGDPINTAMDVVNQDGIPTDGEPQLFAKTKEYKWLVENAGRFSFNLSYPEGNEFGVKYEPWHWRFVE